MSEWDSILTAVEAKLRVAMPDLPAGELGFERADGLGTDLSSSKLPHVFVRVLAEQAVEISDGFGAEEVTIQATLALWTKGETQEEVSVRLDAIRDEIRGNRTLGGIVDRTNVIARQIEEFVGRKHRRAEFVVQVEVDR